MTRGVLHRDVAESCLSFLGSCGASGMAEGWNLHIRSWSHYTTLGPLPGMEDNSLVLTCLQETELECSSQLLRLQTYSQGSVCKHT